MAQKTIGPNFRNELAVAGLLGLPFSWDADGTILFGAAMTGDQIAAVNAAYAAHDPAKADPVAAAASLLAAGLTIASAGTAALDGTYGTTAQDQINLTGLQAAVAQAVFPGFYRDRAGTRHDMTGEQFTAIATAILDFVVAVDEAKATALGGGAWVAPATVANIA
jgi:hypothetical protein